MSRTDTSDRPGDSLPDTYWLARSDSLTLLVAGRARAYADPWFNHGEIYGDPAFLRRRKDEHVVLPLGQPILDDIEKKLGLSAPAPVIDERGHARPDLRRQVDEHNRYHREKRYLESARPGRDVVRALEEAHAYLNRAAAKGALTTAANEARFHCAETLRLLEDGRPADRRDRFPARAAEAVRKAAMALRENDPPPGSSMVLAYPSEIYGARLWCNRALGYVEKSEENREAARSRSAPRTRRGRDDSDRER